MISIVPLDKANNHLLSDFCCIPKNRNTLTENDLSEYNDLNEFFRQDAFNYQSQLLAKTYLILEEERQELVGAYSVANDKIERTNKINRPIPNDKRMPYYPAVKLARFAFQTKAQGKGYGKVILDYLSLSFSSLDNKTGCRFITLDAIPTAKAFYEKHEFKEILQYSTNNKIFMVKDLISFASL